MITRFRVMMLLSSLRLRGVGALFSQGACGCGLFCLLSLVQAQENIQFNRDIRPILSENCFECHGPDQATRKGGNGGLRLDTIEGATEDLGGSAAILPGNPKGSLLISRIKTHDQDDIMPPLETGKEVSDEEIDLLERWIQQGAPYQIHWSYELPIRPQPPVVEKEEASVRNAIDQFILKRAHENGLKQSQEADRHSLARRVALDLTGLPPTLEEAEKFVKDTDVHAFEHYVDRLLKKDAFGEHWARHWLDQARYADSAGYADDPPRTIWGYRDYVIKSFNDNKPFDTFTIEQLAGDLLPNPTEEQLIATAFHRNTMTNNEGGTNDEEFRNVAVVDRVNTTWAVWMGTTMACAQCHTHKYDPITQEEYFQFFDILNQTEDADRRNEAPLITLHTAEQKKQIKDLEDEQKQLQQILKSPSPEIEADRREWEKMLSSNPEWSVLKPDRLSATEGVSLRVDTDQVIRASSPVKNGDYQVEFIVSENKTLTGLKLETIPQNDLPKGGAGFADGNFILSGIDAQLIPSSGKEIEGQFVRFQIKGRNKILSLAEVQVFQGEVNLALNGKAKQSTTAFGGNAELAIDGNVNGDYPGAKSTTHTEISKDPWWELDLGKSESINRIAIWNRTDGNIHNRLDGVKIELLDASRKVVWSEVVTKAPRKSVSFELDGSRALNFTQAHASFSQKGFHASNLVKENKQASPGWAIAPKVNQPHHLTLLLDHSVEIPAGSKLSINLRHSEKIANSNLGAFRFSMTSDEEASLMARTPMAILGLVNTPGEERNQADERRILDYYLTIAPSLDDERKRLATVKKEIEGIKPYTTVPILKALKQNQRRETHIQRRGNYLDKTDLVKPGIPSVFANGLTEMPQDRLSVAKWLVSRNNPLTARVIVNRLWESVFGLGLVRTSEEFGAQGDLPTHPDLLDWLAVEFMDSGWDVKHMLKMIVTSATYRQTSKVNPTQLAADPDNQWLARGPRVRLSAESIRDQALLVSGLLSEKMFGSSVNPPQPKLGLNAAFGSGIDWKTSEGEDRYRRGLYTTWRRSNPYPSMATFDAPNREVCILKRDRSNTPLQALVTLNDPAFVETAQALARRMAQSAANPSGKITHGFRLCLTRPPSKQEQAYLLKLYTEAYSTYVDLEEEAFTLAGQSADKTSPQEDVRDLAALTVVANVLLNLDEVLMKR
jgi:hypothetical protein